MSTEQPMSTTQLLTLILTELRSIKVALQSRGQTSQPPARQPAPNNSSGGQGNSGDNKYARKPNEESATCRDCGNEIIWRKSQAGKNYCVDPDGTYHSKTCTGR